MKVDSFGKDLTNVLGDRFNSHSQCEDLFGE